MKGFLKEFFKTDSCAREFRQRSIIALNMGMCTLNARPPQELKVAIFTPLGDTFRGVPRREVLSGGGNFWRMHRRSEKVSGGPISRNGGGPKLENACPGLPFGHVTSIWWPKDGARRDVSFVTHLICICQFLTKKTRTLFWRCDRNVALDESFPTVVAMWKIFFSILDLFSTGR